MYGVFQYLGSERDVMVSASSYSYKLRGSEFYFRLAIKFVLHFFIRPIENLQLTGGWMNIN